MRRRELILLMAGTTAAWPLSFPSAQQSGTIFRVGVLQAGAEDPESAAVSRDAFQKLGWIEGTNITFERRYAENHPDRLPELAAELVRLNVDVIMAGGTLAPLAAKRATPTIPIVMTTAGDPVGVGLVASLARPGGNVTGLSFMSPDLAGKRLQLLKEVVPRTLRVAVLWDAANPYPARAYEETQRAAQTLGIEVQSLEVRGPDDFAGAFEAAERQQPDALLTIGDPLTSSFRKQIADFASTHRLPAMYPLREYVAAGGLMSYGANASDLVRRAAGYVDKILRGAQPGDLPVEQPTKFELLINLKTANALGLTIPPLVLGLADEVIE